MSARSHALTERTRGLADLAQPRHAPARRSPRDRFRCDDPVADGSAEPIAAIAPPAQGVAAAHHRTRQISDPRRRAQRGRPRSLAGAHRPAAKRRAAHNDMTTRETPAGTTEKTYEMVPRRRGAGGRAGMAGLAAAVEFARSNTAQADARSFRAPDRPVAVPDGDGRTGEGRATRDDFREKKKEVHATRSSLSLRRSGTGLNGINRPAGIGGYFGFAIAAEHVSIAPDRLQRDRTARTCEWSKPALLGDMARCPQLGEAAPKQNSTPLGRSRAMI